LDKNPDYSNGHLVLGRIYQGQAKLDDAIFEFKKVLELDVENLMAHVLLGSLFMQKSDFKAAIDEYQAVLTLNPDDDETPKLLKVAIEKAANATQSAPSEGSKETPNEKESNPGGMASVTMAELYLKQGHLDKAIETYEELLKKEPNHVAARQKLTDLKKKIPDLSGSTPNKAEAAPADSVKPEKGKSAHFKEKGAKFSDDDILQVMSMNRSDNEAKPAEKSKQAETKSLGEKTTSESNSDPTGPYSAAQIEVLKVVLAELAAITGIRRCFLTSLDGIGVVSVGENSNNDSFEKQVLTIFNETNQSAVKLSQGSLKQVLVTAETGLILLVSFAGGVLVVLTDHQINLGMLRLAMDGAAKKIEKAG